VFARNDGKLTFNGRVVEGDHAGGGQAWKDSIVLVPRRLAK